MSNTILKISTKIYTFNKLAFVDYMYTKLIPKTWWIFSDWSNRFSF